MWQDYVFTLGIVVFSIALIPTIRGKEKPAFSTSAPTAFFQYVFLVTFCSLHLWLSAVGSLTLGTLWTILAVQSYKNPRKGKERR